MNKTHFIYLVLFFFYFICADYKGQVGQDNFLNTYYFKNKRNGVFVDIGAYDGIDHSNTYFFEKELGWTGICFEPLGKKFEKLQQNRSCVCINACVSNKETIAQFFEVSGAPEMLSGLVEHYHPAHFERLKHEIKQRGGSYTITDIASCTFNKIMQEYSINYIDYLSIDTEGSELVILKSIDFDSIYIYSISVENNYCDPEIRQFLQAKNFELVTVLGWGDIPQDEIYINKSQFHAD